MREKLSRVAWRRRGVKTSEKASSPDTTTPP
jgi:hypothetical protein